MTPGLTLRKTLLILGALTVVLAAAAGVSLIIGTARISLAEFWSALTKPSDPATESVRTILIDIRLPRVLLAMVVGAALAVSGATFQALLRNPLAEPYILGISSGGTFGALLAVWLGVGLASLTTPLFSFAGSGSVMLLVFALGHRRGYLDTSTLLLSGVMVGAFFSAMILLFTALVNEDMRTTYLWLVGNLTTADMRSLSVVGPLVMLSAAGLVVLSRSFNLIATGDESAMHLGVDVDRVKKISYVLASLTTGLVVSVSGIIGFVGLLVPHACRLLFGPDHRLLVPASCLAGALFLLLCDLASRTILAPSEIPVGVVTAALGAPLFIYLLRKKW